MQLTRDTVTAASRIMLPAYVRFFTVIGAGYLFTPVGRLLGTPALDYADGVLPIKVWGALFIAIAVLMLAALVSERRAVAEYALLLGALSMAIWVVVTILAALFGGATFSGFAYPMLALDACRASYRSLNTREVD